jgi:DNA-binding MarR family transcriptional regulator
MESKELSTLIEQSIGNKLIKTGRVFQEYCLEQLKESMRVEGIKPSHLRLFPYVREEGSTVVELAQALGISKQATSLLVSELIEFEVFIKEDNPNDKRSFLVKLNKKKGSPYLRGSKVFAKQDLFLEELLSSKEMATLSKALDKILNSCQK